MGKILDTITVLFKGDTEDLKRKKKEAEDLAAETAKNLKEIETSTTATNTNLDTTNKTLTQTENLTTGIGEGIAAWVVAAHQATESINEALGAEKAHREQIRIQKELLATKKASEAVEKALVGVVKQFATAALGALSVGRAVGLFKDVVSGTLNLQREAFSLNLDPALLNAYGQAAKSAGGSIDDFIEGLKSLSNSDIASGLTGPDLFNIYKLILKQVRDAKSGVEAQLIGKQYGIPQSIIRAAREKLFDEKNIARIAESNIAISEAVQKVEQLNKAWSEFTTNIRGMALVFENNLLPSLTKLIQLLNLTREFASNPIKALEDISHNPIKAIQTAYEAHEIAFPEKQTNFPLTQGNAVVGNTTTIKINELIVKAPEGTNPEFFGSAVANELHKHIVQLQQYHNGPIVG